VRALRVSARIAGNAAEESALGQRLGDLDARLGDPDDGGLGARLGLGRDDVLLLWAATAAAADPLIAMHLPPLGPRVGSHGLSLAQLAVLADLEPARASALARRVATRAHPLIDLRLIEPALPGPLTPVTGLAATPRLVSFLAGEDVLDPGLAGAAAYVELPDPSIDDPAHRALVDEIAQLLADPSPRAIVLEGRRGVGRRTIARRAAGRRLIALDLESADGPDALIALGREVLLSDAIPLIAGIDASDGDAARREVGRFLDRSRGPVFVTAAAPLRDLHASIPVTRFAVPLPSAPTRAALWDHALADTAVPEAIEGAALRFQLGPAGIRAAAVNARAISAARGVAVDAAAIAEGVRSTVEERLHGLARRHTSDLDWDDVVVPPDTADQIAMLVARVRHAYQVLMQWQFARHLPGPGVAALFTGPPGTGKTMVAGIIGRTLGLELYRVDLSQIVSKWVGETEKHLDAVFDAAETGHAMLLFDEADALFAKRTEVKGATERYANMEVNFLLQRIESFAGVAILTTNLEGSLDPALRRRLSAHIQFPHPDEDERLELWKRLLPAQALVTGQLKLDGLARDFPAFAGAHIRNALTTAAFLAAAEGAAIGADHLRRAAIEEARAMGRMVQGSTR
jgi:ATP-dependent 26S proteasome regulatory subunit